MPGSWQKLVIVVEVDGYNPDRDPVAWATNVLRDQPHLRAAGVRLKRATWAETDADLDDVLDDEEE